MQHWIILTFFSSPNFLARGLANVRSPDEGGALGLETFGSGSRPGSSTSSSFFGVGGADISLAGAALGSDAEG